LRIVDSDLILLLTSAMRLLKSFKDRGALLVGRCPFILSARGLSPGLRVDVRGTTLRNLVTRKVSNDSLIVDLGTP